jgi:hypothetical protein
MAIRWLGNVACVWKKGHSYSSLGGKPGGNRSLGRLRRGWHNGIMMEKWVFSEVR